MRLHPLAHALDRHQDQQGDAPKDAGACIATGADVEQDCNLFAGFRASGKQHSDAHFQRNRALYA